MVRFKEDFRSRRLRRGRRFHPTMVGFKAVDLGVEYARESIVSIPLWCDLKPAPHPPALPPLPGFHPTMVRFKGRSSLG